VHSTAHSNAFAERWVLSVKTECLNRMILFGEDSLRRALTEYGAHFHTERPHQGIGNELIDRPETPTEPNGRVVEHERLGGLLRSYQRAA
jgi:transposase InsO family protein